MACQRRVPLNVHDEQTTYNTAYKNHHVDRNKIKFYRTPFEHSYHEKLYKRKPHIPLDSNTMRPWDKKIDFDALLVPKPITRTHPQEKIRNIVKKDCGLEEAIQSRPRIYMLPAVSMDDIDSKTRKVIIGNMYTSDWKKITSEIKHKCSQRVVPDSTYENPITSSITYKYDLVRQWPLVDPVNWEEKCKEWEENYPKHVVDQTLGFWEDFKHKYENTPGVYPFKDYVSEEEKKEIRELVKKNELSMMYDKFMSGYTGYIPKFARGPLKKQDIVKNPYESLRKK